MFSKVLVANRGAVAARVLRALNAMNIHSVAVYSEADRAALHVRYADEAYFIGPSPSRESYLNAEAILDAARRTCAGGSSACRPCSPATSRRGHRRRWSNGWTRNSPVLTNTVLRPTRPDPYSSGPGALQRRGRLAFGGLSRVH